MYLHTRLLFGILAVTAIALIASAVLPLASLDSDVSAETEASLKLSRLLRDVEQGARGADSGAEALRRAVELVRGTGYLRHVRVVMADAQGRALAEAPTDEHEGGWLVRALQPAAQGRPLPYPVTYRGHVVGMLRLYPNPRSEIAELEGRVTSDVLLMAMMVLAVAVSIYWMVRRGLRPISQINSALTRLAGGVLDTRLPHFRIRDLDEISDRFNHCAGALQEAAVQRQLLTRRLLDVQEDERTRIARELHDELGQTLTAVKVDAAYVVRETHERLPNVADCGRDIERLTTQVMDLIRGILARLRPHGLETVGLTATLEELVNGWRTRVADRFDCALAIEGPADSLSPDLNITLYRLVQECLTNVVRHSEARSVLVSLTVEDVPPRDRPARVWLRVDESDAPGGVTGPLPDGSGLLGMRERVEAHGGELVIRANDARGISLEVWMPQEGSG